MAKTSPKNGKLTALVYQCSGSHLKCYTLCFGSALQSPMSQLEGCTNVNPDKVLVLKKSSLWQSTEARTSLGFDCMSIFSPNLHIE